MSASIKRLQKEYDALISPSNRHIIRNVSYEDSNILVWTGYIVPNEPPYNKGAFKIEIKFPAEYPFKPPTVDFKTRIYHPNVDEHGRICLPIIDPTNWKPATKIENVIQALVAILNSPEIEHALRTDLAEEYTKDNKKFMKSAELHTVNYAEKIPPL